MPVINKSELPVPAPEAPEAVSCFSCSFEKLDGAYRVTGTETLTDAQATAKRTAGNGLLRLICNPTDGVRAVLPEAVCSTTSSGMLRLLRTDEATGQTVEDTEFGFRNNSSQINLGGSGSFFGNQSAGSVIALPSIPVTQSGPTQSLLIRGYYESRNRIYSGVPATMNIQLQMSIDGGTTWDACTGNHANFNNSATYPGSDYQQAVMSRFSNVPTGSYTVMFRFVLLSKSSTTASDEILFTQARLAATWITPVCG